MRTPVLAAVLAFGVSSFALAQEQPAPAPAPAPPAAPAAAATDSVDLFVGDWEWAAQVQDRQMAGTFRVTKNTETGRYNGVVSRQGGSGGANSPIRSFTVRRRSFTMTAEFDGEIFTFSGQLENNGRAGNGNLNFRGGMGRLRVEKRS